MNTMFAVVTLEFEKFWDNVPDTIVLKFHRTSDITIKVSENPINRTLFDGQVTGVALAASSGEEVVPQWFGGKCCQTSLK